jgi:predicted enzyme related to lactoylglutathione lyase
MPHFEIHANNVEDAKTFYAGLFGWTFTPMPGAEDIEYHLISAADIGEGKGLTAGIFKRMDKSQAPGSAIRGGTMTFDVDDCDASYAWALDNGGSEALPPSEMPGIGRFAYVEDGQGNVVGMITSEGAE